MQTHNVKPIGVPEDVLAELDAEQRRLAIDTPLPRPDLVPEDTCSELDREARLGGEELKQTLSEGQPPAADDRDARPS